MFVKIIFKDLSFRTLSDVQKVITSETEDYNNIDIYTKTNQTKQKPKVLNTHR